MLALEIQSMEQNTSNTNSLLKIVRQLVRTIWVLVAMLIVVPILVYYAPDLVGIKSTQNRADIDEQLVHGISPEDTTWKAPPLSEIYDNVELEKVSYGKELIMHTAYYLGPNGVVQQTSNGLNCQNCHLDAGTKTFGNNYASVASMYPKFRARSGSIESLHKRINDCFERSLNGAALDTNSKEMQSIVAYMQFLGSHVPKGKQVSGSGFKDMAYLQRAADPASGRIVYQTKCQSCHQENGEGVVAAHKREFSYPALWGNQSYNDGAGLYRMSNFAKFVKYNMPQGSDYEHPQLTDEEAWDVAAFVNSQPRPHYNISNDWPDISKKPVDHPFGPYVDPFTEQQHKYGPFKPIIEWYKKNQPITASKK